MAGDTRHGLSAAIDTGETRQILDLVERRWSWLLQDDPTSLYKAIQSIPLEAMDGHPATALTSELFLPPTAPLPPVGDQHISTVISGFDTSGDQELRITRGLAAVEALKRRGQYARAAQFGRRLLNALEHEAWTPWQPDPDPAEARLIVGMAELMSGDLFTAEQTLTVGYRQRFTRHEHAADIAGRIALIYAFQGQAHLSRTWIDHANPQHDAERLGIDAAELLLAVDRLDWAAFHQHARATDRHLPTEIWPFPLYARARAALLLGNQREMIEQLNVYRTQIPRQLQPGNLAKILLDTAEAELWMSLGETEQAKSIIEHLGNDPTEKITAAHYYLQTGQPDLARQLTDLQHWPTRVSRHARLNLLLLAATARLHLGQDDQQTLQLLHQAMIETADEVDPWLFSLIRTEPRTLQHLQQHIPGAEPLLTALPSSSPGQPANPITQIRLTRREHTLLRHLAGDEPLTAIAAQLHISNATVRSHRKNLYRKLGATSRTQAVMIARRTGLL